MSQGVLNYASPLPLDLSGAKKPLGQVVWGVVIVVFDFNLNGFDVVNDVIGCLMIAAAVGTLRRLDVDEPYQRAMRFVGIMAWLSVFVSLREQLIGDVPTPLALLEGVSGVAAAVACVVFCVAMRRLCGLAGLMTVARSWHTTTMLGAILYAAPLIVFYVGAMFVLLTSRSPKYTVGSWLVPLLLACVVPAIHFLISVSRTRVAADVQARRWQAEERARAAAALGDQSSPW